MYRPLHFVMSKRKSSKDQETKRPVKKKKTEDSSDSSSDSSSENDSLTEIEKNEVYDVLYEIILSFFYSSNI